MDISICIVTHSQPLLLAQCVASCVSETSHVDTAAEIIVIDNASLDRYPEKLSASTLTVRIIRSDENLGFGAANNRAIRAARGRFVLLLNDDAVLLEGSLAPMLSALKSSPQIGAVGPTLCYPDGSMQHGFMNRRFPLFPRVLGDVLFLGGPVSKRLVGLCERDRRTKQWLTTLGDPQKSDVPDQVAGACMLIRRQALDEVGLFDERFYYIFEDADLCYRLRKAGWQILCVHAARVTHYGRATYDQWSRSDQIANLLRSINYFLRKHSSRSAYLAGRLTLGLALLFGITERSLVGMIRRTPNRRRLDQGDLLGSARASLRLLRSVVFGK